MGENVVTRRRGPSKLGGGKRKNRDARREQRRQDAEERAEQRAMLANTLTDAALRDHDADSKTLYDAKRAAS